MPRRNLLTLIIMTLVAVVCHEQAQQSGFGRVVGSAMAKIESQHLEPIDPLVLFERAMSGMLDRLDEHSAYIPPDDAPGFKEELDNEFAGVGIEVEIDPETKQLRVRSPMFDSPAYKAGILAGDRIVRIDKTGTEGLSLEQVKKLLRGNVDESVTLSVVHSGEKEPVEIKVVRQIIHVSTVLGDTRNKNGSWNFFLEGHDRIGYVRITAFSNDTAKDLERVLRRLAAKQMRGLILDLRNDPGGYLDAAIDVCRLLIDPGIIVTTRGRGDVIKETYRAEQPGAFTGVPMAVLVNQDTASAAEIVAACLQDQHRAVIVGQRSYGKGTVQEVVDLGRYGMMKFTAKSYWRPSGKNIQRPAKGSEAGPWGVSPDKGYDVPFDSEEFTQWQLWRRWRSAYHPPGADRSPEEKPFADRQLLRAVEYLEKQVARRAPLAKSAPAVYNSGFPPEVGQWCGWPARRSWSWISARNMPN
jgi:carboxyl-terminal processing protease